MGVPLLGQDAWAFLSGKGFSRPIIKWNSFHRSSHFSLSNFIPVSDLHNIQWLLTGDRSSRRRRPGEPDWLIYCTNSQTIRKENSIDYCTRITATLSANSATTNISVRNTGTCGVSHQEGEEPRNWPYTDLLLNPVTLHRNFNSWVPTKNARILLVYKDSKNFSRASWLGNFLLEKVMKVPSRACETIFERVATALNILWKSSPDYIS